jgi:carbon-monoxide dehydrogenase medium subunit/2-furoyl-CoA dehydrogenase FAD binding subunit
MKAAPFDYALAHDLDHALTFLDQYGMDAKLIAGGQSLVPMMAMRLARPEWLIDINRIQALKRIELTSTQLTTGACVRQRDIEYNEPICNALPLIKKALHWVGHQQTRNRGTVGGSLVYADPSAELPLTALVLGATLHLQSHQDGTRDLAASDFFLGPMFTAVADTECVTHIDWPIWSGSGIGSAFEETAIRKGDFAMASAAAQIQLDANARVLRASFGVGGMDGTPRVFPQLAQQMVGRLSSDIDLKALAHEAVKDCEPGNDMHCSSDYRRHLARVLIERVIEQALQRARN